MQPLPPKERRVSIVSIARPEVTQVREYVPGEVPSVWDAPVTFRDINVLRAALEQRGAPGILVAFESSGALRDALIRDGKHAMSAADPGSAGVVLTTETPDNLPYYEHFGYRILGQARAEELTTWTLFRPDSG